MTDLPAEAAGTEPTTPPETPATPSLGRRRALVVGIDVYMPEGTAPPPVVRPVSNLQGSVNDALAMQAALTSRFGFPAADVRLLTNQAASRAAIETAFREHLIGPSQPGDEVAFFYAGHGSQVANSQSDELDRLDETLVPADAAFGAAELRDKELRRLLNELLDRGVRLTVILDSCHSGSAWRGLPPAGLSRSLPRSPLTVADGPPYGPLPEERGALILAAAQDFECAWETRDAEDRPRGAFSLALLTAIDSAGPGESVAEIYQRARARLQTGAARQEPVLAGPPARTAAPLFGGIEGAALGTSRPPVAVQEVDWEKVVHLQGGWTSGLVEGSELVRRADPEKPGEPAVRIRVSERPGPASAKARWVAPEPEEPPEEVLYRDGRPASSGPAPVEVKEPEMPPIEPGDLFDLVGWTVAGDASLSVWVPGAEAGRMAAARRLAGELASAAGTSFDWVLDPTEVTPTHLLRPSAQGWELAGPAGIQSLAAAVSAREVVSAVAGSTGGAAGERPRLFVHLPVPAELAEALRLGAGTINDAVARTAGPAGAHYHLVGRLANGAAQVAWIRPDLGPQDQAISSLPARSEWLRLDTVNPQRTAGTISIPGTQGPTPIQPTHPLAYPLEDTVLRLSKIRAWLLLESPPPGDFPYQFPYRLALRRRGTAERLQEGELRPGEYDALLWAPAEDEGLRPVPRAIYIFLMDSYGRSTLLFPFRVQGNVENRFPLRKEGQLLPLEIPCSDRPVVKVRPPYGTDTYFLLSTEEPLARPAILEADGVRRGGPKGASALEDLLAHRGNAERGGTAIVPANWSLEKLVFQSVPG